MDHRQMLSYDSKTISVLIKVVFIMQKETCSSAAPFELFLLFLYASVTVLSDPDNDVGVIHLHSGNK